MIPKLQVLNVTADELGVMDDETQKKLLKTCSMLFPENGDRKFWSVGFFWWQEKVWAVPYRHCETFEKTWPKAQSIPTHGRQAMTFMQKLADTGADCLCLSEVEEFEIDIDACLAVSRGESPDPSTPMSGDPNQ